MAHQSSKSSGVWYETANRISGNKTSCFYLALAHDLCHHFCKQLIGQTTIKDYEAFKDYFAKEMSREPQRNRITKRAYARVGVGHETIFHKQLFLGHSMLCILADGQSIGWILRQDHLFVNPKLLGGCHLDRELQTNTHSAPTL